jgi:plasmid stabilization system protein ParE
MAYKVFISPEAELDLEDTYNCCEAKDTDLGSEFIRVVDASLSAIQRNPLAYASVYKEIRRKLIRKFPYGLFYLVKDEIIVVVACFHVKRDPKQWKRRF